MKCFIWNKLYHNYVIFFFFVSSWLKIVRRRRTCNFSNKKKNSTSCGSSFHSMFYSKIMLIFFILFFSRSPNPTIPLLQFFRNLFDKYPFKRHDNCYFVLMFSTITCSLPLLWSSLSFVYDNVWFLNYLDSNLWK